MPPPTCTYCRKYPARPGLKRCGGCADYFSRMQTIRYRRWRRLGLCVHCGGERDRPPCFNCSACLAGQMDRWRRYYADPAVRERKRAYARKLYWEAKAARAERLAAKQRRTA